MTMALRIANRMKTDWCVVIDKLSVFHILNCVPSDSLYIYIYIVKSLVVLIDHFKVFPFILVISPPSPRTPN